MHKKLALVALQWTLNDMPTPLLLPEFDDPPVESVMETMMGASVDTKKFFAH